MKGRPTNEQFRMQLEQMVSTLRSEIFSGQYSYGDYLPSEKMLAERFQLGNLSVRKGLEQLVEESLIEKIPRVGNRVCIEREPKGKVPVRLKLSISPMTMRNLELSRLLSEFQKQYPWIRVECKETSGWLTDCDVVMMDNSQFLSLVEGEEGDPELVPLIAQPDIFPRLLQAFMQNGQLFMQPVVFSPVVLCYNKAHFRECGLEFPDGDWTWDDLTRSADRLSEVKGRYGFSFHVPDTNRWPLFLLQSGGAFEWNGDRLKSIRGTPLMEGIRLCRSLIQNRKSFPLYMSESSYETGHMFMEGKISMMLTTYLGLNRWRQFELEYDISPVPFMTAPKTLMICLGVGVHAKTRYPEEARLLAEFFTSLPAQRLIQKNTMSIPSSRLMPVRVSDNRIYRPERYQLFREIMYSLRTHDALNMPTRIFPVLFSHIKAYWADLIDDEELCTRLETIHKHQNISDTSKEVGQ